MPLNHPCPFCDRRCRSEWNLVRHVWKAHTTKRGGNHPRTRVVWDTEAGERFLLECVGWKGQLPDQIDCFCDDRFHRDALTGLSAIDSWLIHLEQAGGLAAHILDLSLKTDGCGQGMVDFRHLRGLA